MGFCTEEPRVGGQSLSGIRRVSIMWEGSPASWARAWAGWGGHLEGLRGRNGTVGYHIGKASKMKTCWFVCCCCFSMKFQQNWKELVPIPGTHKYWADVTYNQTLLGFPLLKKQWCWPNSLDLAVNLNVSRIRNIFIF